MNLSKEKDFDLVPLGRIAIDFNPTDMMRPLSESRSFKKYLGGSPANIAVGLAVLGKKVGFIGKVSDDEMGVFVTDFFKKKGIDTSGISLAKNGESLGLTFTEIKSETESSILMYRDGVADLNLEPSEVSEEYIKRSKILLISGTSLAQSPSREAAFTAMAYARKHNVPIIFDIDYRRYTWKNKYELAVYYSLAGEMSDIILGSREEFSLMEALCLPGNQSDEESAKYWLAKKSELIIIKHGAEGSTAFSRGGECIKIKPFPVHLLKSFGGGDGYASAFIYGLLEGYPLSEALEFASASAAILVSAHSCSEAMPSVSEIKSFMAEKKAQHGENVARG